MDSILKKKLVTGGAAAFLALGVLAGCGAEEEETDTGTDIEETETEDTEMEETETEDTETEEETQ
ncbi:hypothetical protein [Domibacillus iocasae]|uniref:Uncharacterized protein n=1 Tax=Domibacillus iocasae TaxID=1714016 RepID=A0A1E7DV59_9BACI|nr:hypothetical protein [Domibacillus iocasae]OES46568.1 hypothetical protein BA724_00480 [Domibacillus iocasae]